MKTDLLKGLAPQAKAERKAVLHGCAPGLKIVEDVLQEKLLELYAKLLKPQYDTPSWASLQADMVGEARAYKYVIELLSLDREKD